jgi:hypothetical protein
MMVLAVQILPLMALNFLEISPNFASAILSHYLHPQAQIQSELDPGVFNESTACLTAIFQLGQTGVTDIQICEVIRIEAPLSGYLVSATGNWNSENGKVYSVFRTGILDGEENADDRGQEFVFLAAGVSENGAVYLFPEPVLNADSTEAFVVAYEYLNNIDDFLSLSVRYPR